MDKLLTIQEAAALLGVHPETLRRWDNDGKLKAIKVGNRGDRKYREVELSAFLSSYNRSSYKNFDIIPHGFGFEISPGTLIRIASFIVKNEKTISGFAFAEGMLNRMSHPEISDENLLVQANSIIKEYINTEKIQNFEEYTFELHHLDFIAVNAPHWWKKTLKITN